MASKDEEENAPLLENSDESFSVGKQPRTSRIKSLYETNHLFNNTENDCQLPTSSSMQNVREQMEQDSIVSIFVIAFDTKAGNLVEWCMPEDADLEGIEFKAMASGSHTLNNDFVYFRKDSMYGLSCFENMPVESQIERGARMKSVGIIATSYTLLYRHMQFLEKQVRHQLETPGKYSQLKAFYEDKKGILLTQSESTMSNLSVASAMSTGSNSPMSELKINHPSGCFSQFIKFFGVKIFTLWKFSLLQKRILFFSPPPVGVVCYRVYCLCCLANHNVENSLTDNEVRPYFYVNVADIETLESELSYVACTTERIFETKKQLYDVYVDNQNLTTHIPLLRDLLKISDSDRNKYQTLTNQRSAHLYETGESDIDEEEMFTNFFMEQNNRLFQTLLDVSMSHDRQLTSDNMRQMGLDPVGDRAFLMELIETYGIDVMLMVDNPCCPR